MDRNREERALRLSVQRALWGAVPTSLRAVSAEIVDCVIRFRAVFTRDATEEDRELLSCAAAEVIADYREPFTIHEEWVDLDPPARPMHLRHLMFLRAELDEHGEYY